MIFVLKQKITQDKVSPSGSNSGGISIDDETGESFAGRALRVGIGSSQNEVVAGHASVCDPEQQQKVKCLIKILFSIFSYKNVQKKNALNKNQTFNKLATFLKFA
jgi:hypothetical protein